MKKSIKALLARLDPKKKEQLTYAFEEGLTNQYVEYEPGRFIGVNIDGLHNLNIEQEAGVWSSGTILQGQVPRDPDIISLADRLSERETGS